MSLPRMVALRSPASAWISLTAPAGPSAARFFATGTEVSTADIASSGTPLRVTRVRMLSQVRPSIEPMSWMMPLRSNLAGRSRPALTAVPRSQETTPVFRWSAMFVMKRFRPAPTAFTRLPRNPIGSLMI
ncbi:hypothetical protein AMK28_10525, partial [Streptomyces sp. CB02115]